MTERLEAVGFSVESLRFGPFENFWAKHGSGGPVFCFAGHTDVVASGPIEDWQTEPFVPVVKDGIFVWPRRRRHEERARGHGDGKRGIREALPCTSGQHRVPHHQR